MSRVRIIGVGTRFGDDRIGLELAARLRGVPAGDCEVVTTERPGVELLDLLAGSERVVVLDAVHSGTAAGTIHDWALADVRLASGALSSHGISLADMLGLAAALGRLPRGRFIGIEAARKAAAMDAELSVAVAAALPAVVQRVHAWVARWQGERAGDVEGSN